MELATVPATPVTAPSARYRPLAPRIERLPAGYRHEPGALPLPSAIVVDRDIAIPLRDGVTVYADVFRPDDSGPVPAIVSWAPYGKGGTGFWDLNNPLFPRRFGVPRAATSGLQSWESPDPAYWCDHGYAVVQVDARGAFNSEGDVRYIGQFEGCDAHDAIEHLAGLPWCTGKVGMAGNSWLAMVQWQAAAQRPPHLAAIAPWEGCTDLYHDVMVLGGIPNPHFAAAVREHMYGLNRVEDPVAMLEARPDFDDYWGLKVADLASIEVPAYVAASYTSTVHSYGTFRGWQAIRGPKWLRIHNSHEWPDFYVPERVEDLRRFFDRYLRDVENGWETTPPVRYSVLDPGGVDTVDRPDVAFPPTGVSSMDLHLDGRDRSLRAGPVTGAGEARYSPAAVDRVTFSYSFEQDIEVVGHPLLTLWVSVEGADDVDVYACLVKRSRLGLVQHHQLLTLGLPAATAWMPHAYRWGAKQMSPAFYPGAAGQLRASRRALDPASVERGMPMHDGRFTTPVPQGEPFRMDVPLWPIGMRWRRGERLDLVVSARPLRAPELPDLPPPARQSGRFHVVHTGGQHASLLRLPVQQVHKVRPARRLRRKARSVGRTA